MEELLVKTLPGLGTGGVLAIAFYYMAKRYFEDAKEERTRLEKAREESTSQMNSRIAILEGHVTKCEEDRSKLWERLVNQASNQIIQPK